MTKHTDAELAEAVDLARRLERTEADRARIAAEIEAEQAAREAAHVATLDVEAAAQERPTPEDVGRDPHLRRRRGAVQKRLRTHEVRRRVEHVRIVSEPRS